MEKLTYKQAFDKITEAYIKGEIQPYLPSFCFCGTLCDNSHKWFVFGTPMYRPYNGYKGNDFMRMETALLTPLHFGGTDISNEDYRDEDGVLVSKEIHPEYEDRLFSGMCAALEVLKQIHIERNEDVDDSLTLTKRELSHV